MLLFRCYPDFGGGFCYRWLPVPRNPSSIHADPGDFQEESVRKKWKRRVAKAIEKYEKTRAESKKCVDWINKYWRDCLCQRCMDVHDKVSVVCYVLFEGLCPKLWTEVFRNLGSIMLNQIPGATRESYDDDVINCPSNPNSEKIEQELWL
ncbi:hypothetical protein Tco_0720114 [Tanacetum coccineum]